jgi:hypothetical protein
MILYKDRNKFSFRPSARLEPAVEIGTRARVNALPVWFMRIAPAVQVKSEFKRYLFTYRFGGDEWSLEIPALSLEEAKERVKVLPFAECHGEQRREAPPRQVRPRRSIWFTRAA